ncbi:hypothetical protein QE152_g36698 [Popillia japonica]|uniref:Uncharacterized protein n=1 Tax=Popillia japonica TaxID=7064 RepID=A0AAW1ICH6_POPJA
MQILEETSSDNLKSGFRKGGIYPLNLLNTGYVTADETIFTKETRQIKEKCTAWEKANTRNQKNQTSGTTSENESEVQYQENNCSPSDKQFSCHEDTNSVSEETPAIAAIEKSTQTYVVVNYEGKYFHGKI